MTLHGAVMTPGCLHAMRVMSGYDIPQQGDSLSPALFAKDIPTVIKVLRVSAGNQHPAPCAFLQNYWPGMIDARQFTQHWPSNTSDKMGDKYSNAEIPTLNDFH